MIQIAHFEVYVDRGAGWQLEERFAEDNRQDAFNLAKEREADKFKVKIIKEIFDVQNNTYQESVEYISNPNKSKPQKKKRFGGGWASKEEDDDVSFAPPPVKTMVSRTGLAGAILKLVLLITVSLLFANLFVGLIFPLLEIFVPEENSRPVLFGVFLVVFLAMSVPLLLKSIPWHIFTGRHGSKIGIKEEKFYTKADELIRAYNLNSDKDPVVTPAYPEAPIEYKQYIVSFLSDLLSQLESQTVMLNRFSRLGLKLLVYGGCLELARYSGLTMAEANSVLYDALKIIDGKSADLEAFYEAKRSYRDNKIAIFLTGVGAHIMAQVIGGLPISSNLLNIAFNKWENQDAEPKFDRTLAADIPEPEAEMASLEIEAKEPHANIKTSVSLKSDLKFMDNSIPDQEKIATDISSQLRNIVSNLQNKYQGFDVVEIGGTTTIQFNKIANAIKFATNVLTDISTYQEGLSNDNLLMRNCCAITIFKEEDEPSYRSSFLADMFEHIYNNEIVMTANVQANLKENPRHLDYLGEKQFKNLGIDVELYKLLE
ncbi:MAG: hypothetical protein E7018_01730 [Alphaproteobacteria bacterium]|nr:hypothetical protein [Alphaproteobacteria bacterium]